jgi:hypothetical protein
VEYPLYFKVFLSGFVNGHIWGDRNEGDTGGRVETGNEPRFPVGSHVLDAKF